MCLQIPGKNMKTERHWNRTPKYPFKCMLAEWLKRSVSASSWQSDNHHYVVAPPLQYVTPSPNHSSLKKFFTFCPRYIKSSVFRHVLVDQFLLPRTTHSSTLYCSKSLWHLIWPKNFSFWDTALFMGQLSSIFRFNCLQLESQYC